MNTDSGEDGMDTGEDWRFDDLARLPGVMHYLVVTTDGLLRACSPDLEQDAAERLAVAASGAYAVNGHFAEFFGKTPDAAQSRALSLMLERPDDGYVAIVDVQEVAYLAVAMTFEANVSHVIETMRKMATKVPTFLGTTSRVVSGPQPPAS